MSLVSSRPELSAGVGVSLPFSHSVLLHLSQGRGSSLDICTCLLKVPERVTDKATFGLPSGRPVTQSLNRSIEWYQPRVSRVTLKKHSSHRTPLSSAAQCGILLMTFPMKKCDGSSLSFVLDFQWDAL